MKEYFKMLLENTKQLLISIDQIVNNIIFFFIERVHGDETLSAHAYRLYLEKGNSIPMKIIDTIFMIFNDVNHCEESFKSEVVQRQLPPIYHERLHDSLDKCEDIRNNGR